MRKRPTINIISPSHPEALLFEEEEHTNEQELSVIKKNLNDHLESPFVVRDDSDDEHLF